MPDSTAKVGGDFSGLINESEKAAKSLISLAAKITALANPVNLASKAIGGMVDGLGKIGLAAMGVEALGKSAISMASGLLKGNAALEMTTISFKTLLGSASAADDMIKQLTDFAASTPFELAGLESQTQRLLAFGFGAKEVIPLMTSLGDAISALGGTQDNLNSLVYVMGQMRQEAHINAGDIMQMVNLGIPALQMLADHYHVTTGEIQSMITKGLIPGNEAVKVLSDSMEKKYGGMMAAQSSTFNGMLSNLQDWASATMITLTKPIFEPAKKGLKALLDFVQSPQGVVVINKMAADIQVAVDKATAAFVRFEPQIKPTLERLLKVAEAVRQQVTPGLLTLIPLVEKLWSRFEPLALSIWKVYQSVQPMNIAFAVMKGLLTGGVTGAVDAFKERFALIEGYVKKGLDLALTEIKKFGAVAIDWLLKEAQTLAAKLLSWGESFIQWVTPYIPKLIQNLEQLAGRLFNWVLTVGPVIAGKVLTWGESFIKWIAPYAVKLVNELIKLGLSVVAWVISYAPVLANQLLRWAEVLVGWILVEAPQAIKALTSFAGQVINWVVAEAPIIATAMLGWAASIVDWALPQVPKILNALGRVGTEILHWVEKYGPVLARSLIKWTEILAGWIVPAIPGVIRALEVMGAAIVSWGINRLPVLIGDVIVGIGQGIGINLQRPVGDVLKIFNSLVLNIRTIVLPAFLQMVSYLSINVMPLLDRLSNFIAQTLIPTAAKLAAFVMTTLVPIFVNITDVLGRLFGPALTLIGSIIRNELLPALTDSWNYFDSKYMPTVRDLASAMGEKLADGIRTATDKFEAAVPKLEAFYKKLEPIVGKALDLYKAISPVSIALDVLKGFVTGGLQGGLGALEQHVVDLGKVFGLNLQAVIDWFNDTVVKNVIPTLKDWAKTFIEDWWPKIRDAVVFAWNKLSDFWDFVSTKIWPPFKSFLDWLGQQFDKVGKAIGDTWENTIKPALSKFWDYVANKLWPTLRDDVFPWIEKNVKPKLETAFSILADTIIPNMGKLVDIILNHVIPTLVAWWGVLYALVNPFLKTCGDLVGKIVDGLKDSKDPLSKTTDGFKNLADQLKGVFDFLGKVVGGFHTLWFMMGGWLVGPIFDYIGNLVKMFGLVGDIVDKLQRGDIAGVAADAQQAINIAKGAQIISGNGSQMQTNDQRLQQYMKDHPEYNPTAAGNVPKKASGDRYWRGGLVQVGEAGAELIKTLAGQIMLATQPTTLNLPAGAQIFNAQQTLDIFHRLPASSQQISNMYQNSHANTWDNSISNSHNTSNQYNYYGQPSGGYQMSPGMQRVWFSKS